MHDLKVIDSAFNLLAVIDNYRSVMIGRKLYEIGKFEINMQYSASGADQIVPGRIVFIDVKRPGLITGVEIKETKKGAEMVAHGIQLKGIVAQRVTVPDINDESQTFGFDRFPAPGDPEAPAETVIKYYIDKHMINPSDANRAVAQLAMAADQARGINMRWSTRFEKLDTVLKAIGEWSGMGYDIMLDLDNQNFVFDVLPGIDRSATSETPVVFSVSFGNVDSTNYARDRSPLVNVAYAGGAGDAEGRLIQSVFVGSPASGLNRREMWLDCGNVEFIDDLIYEANHRLQNYTETETLTSDIAITGPFQYGEDWDVGDIVTVQSRTLNIERDAQITEAVETYEGGKRDVNITFGKRQKTILDEIRKTEVIR